MDLLKDRVVLITGGSSGIGRAAAHAFAAAGARVVLAARGTERGEAVAQAIREAGGEARFVQADVSQPADVARLVAETVAVYGRLDAAFNNAATKDGVFAMTAEFSEEQFDRAIAANLKSIWLCMKHEIQQMLAQSPPGGAIVNTSSVNGLGGAPGGSLYSAAKAGVLALTKSAAQEYAAQGIRVNALVAGAFRTPMLESVFEHHGGGTAEGAAAVEEKYAEHTALRRIGRPEEAAAAAVWLCSDAASYVTGHSMIVDGGMTAAVR
ncbi:MAG TPA: glucose 1-dehydrogenase [Thermoanaerobaculia bacterium]|jgi:NAD(P)-dependent dehydrogenase (short-subunit alcohol dehydrogenase family)